MADDVDDAQAVIEANIGNELARRRSDAAKQEKARLVLEAQKDIHRECVDCGCDIPRQRLIAVPLTKRCADCQNELERRR